MIQRIQSLYLLVGAALVVLFIALGDAWFAAVASAYPVLPVVATVLAGVTALAALLAVFFYRNRDLQRKVIATAQWLDLALVLVLVGGLAALTFGGGVALAPGVGVYLAVLAPILAYVMLRLARRGVEKDIALVRSMDRLR